MRFNRVEEVSAVVLGADQADPVQGSVVQSVLVRLHLQTQKTVPRTSPVQSTSLLVKSPNSPQGHSCWPEITRVFIFTSFNRKTAKSHFCNCEAVFIIWFLVLSLYAREKHLTETGVTLRTINSRLIDDFRKQKARQKYQPCHKI